MKKNIAKVLLLALTLSAVSPMQDAEAAKKLTLSEKSLSMKVGATKTVKANKAVKWKISGKKVVKLNKLSGKKVKITAKKVGTCKVTAIAGKKKASIRINVSKAKKNVKSTPTHVAQRKGALTEQRRLLVACGARNGYGSPEKLGHRLAVHAG